jgi:DNA replication and repair protein RecF
MPEPGLNIIRGENAQGKTSLLEAILYLATSKSHRATAESELAQHGTDGFSVLGRARRAEREVRLEARWYRGVKRLKVNDVAQERISDILGKMSVVFFSPDDVALVRGAASTRRRFLDMELSQLNPAYLRALQQYRQALRQRNALLRSPSCDTAVLTMWDGHLAKYGDVLRKERAAFLQDLNAHAVAAYKRIAEREDLRIRYKPNVKQNEPLEEALAAAHTADRKQGVTTRGPHRDDFLFDIGDHKARAYASQGQQKTAALAVKLAEGVLVSERTGEYPILMFDDVLSELDAGRAARLIEGIPDSCQCLLTTTDLTAQDGVFGEGCAYFRIEGGRLERE